MPNQNDTISTKKFLDVDGLRYLANKMNSYPDNDVIEAVIDGVQDALDEKVDLTAIGDAAAKSVDTSISNGSSSANLPTSAAVASFVENKGYKTTDNDTKNTAGSTDTSSKIFLVGAKTQAANPQTYSHDTAYVGTDGCLYSGGTKVLTAHQDISGKLDSSLKGAASGLAELDASGKVPSSQLPSYVDDVLEYISSSSFPTTGETGKIYVDTTTNKTYRWSGSSYTEISASIALGETSSTAYRGDRGKTAYDHANAKGSAFSSGLYKITTNAQGHVTDAAAVQKSDITDLGIPAQDTTYSNMGAATSSTAGTSGLVPAPAAGQQSKFLRGDGTWQTPTNTKNTAGSTDSSSKLFLIGATSQAANPQTYSQDTAYVGTDGHLYSDSKQVVNISGAQNLTNKTINGYTPGAALAKDVTDNTTSTAPDSTDTNLITGRTLYYAIATDADIDALFE